MKNYCIKDSTGREHWISRSVAVVVFLFAKDDNKQEYILVNQRGKGTPDPEYIGKYCVPCGYLDYDETLTEAAARELKEETGLDIPISDFRLVSFNDNPYDDKRQNITFRFVIESSIPVKELEKLLTSEYSEKDEVESIRFINLSNLELYEWAFNHEELIKKVSSQKEKTKAYR